MTLERIGSVLLDPDDVSCVWPDKDPSKIHVLFKSGQSVEFDGEDKELVWARLDPGEKAPKKGRWK